MTAEFIGVRVFSFEKTLDIQPFNLNFFGMDGLSFNRSSRVLLRPFVFVIVWIMIPVLVVVHLLIDCNLGKSLSNQQKKESRPL